MVAVDRYFGIFQDAYSHTVRNDFRTSRCDRLSALSVGPVCRPCRNSIREQSGVPAGGRGDAATSAAGEGWDQLTARSAARRKCARTWRRHSSYCGTGPEDSGPAVKSSASATAASTDRSAIALVAVSVCGGTKPE